MQTRTCLVCIVYSSVVECHRKEHIAECLGGKGGAGEITLRDLRIRIGLEHLRMDVVEMQGKIIAVCVDLQVQVGVEAEVGWSAREDDAAASGERGVAIEGKAGHARDRKGEDDADEDYEDEDEPHEYAAGEPLDPAEPVLVPAEGTPCGSTLLGAGLALPGLGHFAQLRRFPLGAQSGDRHELDAARARLGLGAGGVRLGRSCGDDSVSAPRIWARNRTTRR